MNADVNKKEAIGSNLWGVDVIEIDGLELRHFDEQEFGVALPADTAGVGWPARGLENVPFPGLIGRDEVGLVDTWGNGGVGYGGSKKSRA